MSSGKKSGAQPGNDNAKEGARWREALRRALSRAAGSIDAGLDKCADKLVAAAVKGTPWALEHIAERMDGRSVQHISATIEHTVATGASDSLAERLTARQKTPQHSVQ